MTGNVVLPRGLARRTSFRREWKPRGECPPPSEDDILENCEIALDILRGNVRGAKDLAEKIDRRLRMQETPRDPDREIESPKGGHARDEQGHLHCVSPVVGHRH